MNLGCETYSIDYNPVAIFIQKCMMEFIENNVGEINTNEFLHEQKTNPFLIDIEKWFTWIIEKSYKELAEFYKTEKKDAVPIGYIWSRTITCPNPNCKKKTPLIKQFWLSRKKNREIAFYPYISSNDLKFKIVGHGYEKMPKNFNPDKGNIKRGIGTCLYCNSAIDGKTVKEKISESKSNDMQIITIHQNDTDGKTYHVSSENELILQNELEKKLKEKIVNLTKKWNFSPIPDEQLPPKNSHRAVGSQLPLYGLVNFGDLFNNRQLLTIITIIEKLKDAYELMKSKYSKEDYPERLVALISLIISKNTSYNCKLCWWEPIGERCFNAFGRQTFAMIFDYSEQNPFETLTGNFKKLLKTQLELINKISSLTNKKLINIKQGSVMHLPYTDSFFDAVITDPPYYDNIPYSYLSDFFYVWLKRSVGEFFQEIFNTPLTPKLDEIVVYQNQETKELSPKELFENRLSIGFKEIWRVLKPNGIVIIVYTHKTTQGWETLINSLSNSGLIITAAWPINTELQTRLIANETATLSSSIYIVCRKWNKEPHESYNNVKKQMQEYLDKKLDFLWSQDIRGADFFISAIGSAIEVFGKYEKITDNADNEIKVPQLLEDVRKIVSEYAIKQALHGDIDGEISTMTRFYVLWRSAYGQAKVPYDDARKLATSLGVNLEQEGNKGFIKKESEIVRVIGPEDRSVDEIKEPTELIDVLHKVLILWRYGGKESLEELLTETGYANNYTFRRVAQAISESLPDEIQEKKWLDGFLTGFTESGGIDDKQTKLF